MAQFGLGFSQQEVNRKCRTVLYRDRYKNSKFKSLGNNVMRRMKVVRSMENVDTETFTDPAPDKHQPQEAVTIIIGFITSVSWRFLFGSTGLVKESIG